MMGARAARIRREQGCAQATDYCIRKSVVVRFWTVKGVSVTMKSS